jgi:diketogulonate reductase-like aldo/keto reductase
VQVSVGIAMAESGLPRENIFLLQKTGNWNTMGYNDTLLQMELILEQMNLTYVDLLLNHWPTSPASTSLFIPYLPHTPSSHSRTCRNERFHAPCVTSVLFLCSWHH